MRAVGRGSGVASAPGVLSAAVPSLLLLLPTRCIPVTGLLLSTYASFLSSPSPFSLPNEISAKPSSGQPARVSHQINSKEINTIIRAFSAFIWNLTRAARPAPEPGAAVGPVFSSHVTVVGPTPSRLHAPHSPFVSVGPAAPASPLFVRSFIPIRCDFDEAASEPLRPFCSRRPGAAVELPRPSASRRSRRLCALY